MSYYDNKREISGGDSSNPNSKFVKGRLDIKIIVIGDSGTGKTAFVKRWLSGNFSEQYKATILSEYSHKMYKYNDYNYKIHLWDIAGQDKNIYTSKVFVKGAHGSLILCDITQPETMNKALKWKKSVDENGLFVDGSPIPSYLVQNKIDLVDEEKLKDTEEIKNFSETNGFVNFARTSCKDGTGIDEVMDDFLKNIIDRLEEFNKKKNIDLDNRKNTSIVVQKLAPSTESLLKKKSCC